MTDIVTSTDELTESERQYITDLRAQTMGMLSVYERRLGFLLTTPDKLLWLRERGPDEDTIFRQVEHIKKCRRP